MLIWLMIAVVLALLGVVEMMLGFTLPFTGLRTLLLFLLVLGIGYRMYDMESSQEKEHLKQKVRELEDKVAGLGTETAAADSEG